MAYSSKETSLSRLGQKSTSVTYVRDRNKVNFEINVEGSLFSFITIRSILCLISMSMPLIFIFAHTFQRISKKEKKSYIHTFLCLRP